MTVDRTRQVRMLLHALDRTQSNKQREAFRALDQIVTDRDALAAKVETLTEALETWPDDGSVHEHGCLGVDSPDDCDCYTSIVRAALAKSEETP